MKVYCCGQTDVCMCTELVSDYRLHPQMIVTQCGISGNSEPAPRGRREEEEDVKDAFPLEDQRLLLSITGAAGPRLTVYVEEEIKMCVCVCVLIPP